MRALVFLFINQHTKFEVPSFTNSPGIWLGQNLNTVTWPWPRQLGGSLSSEG